MLRQAEEVGLSLAGPGHVHWRPLDGEAPYGQRHIRGYVCEWDGSGRQSQPTPEAREGRIVNLLDLIDPGRDAVAGAWKREGDILVSDGSPSARLAAPYHPPREYDVGVMFTIHDAKACVAILCSQGESPFAFSMNAGAPRRCRLEDIDGHSVSGNPTLREYPFESGETYAVIVSVREDGLSASINRQEILSYKTDYHDLSRNPKWRMKDPRRIGLGSWNGPVEFHRAEVREVSGRGRLLTGSGTDGESNGKPLPDGTLELIPYLSPERDKLRPVGQLHRQKDVLFAEGAHFQLPVLVEGSYTLSIDFKRTSGEGIVLCFPFGDDAATLQLSRWNDTRTVVPGLEDEGLDTDRRGIMRNGKAYSLVVDVHVSGDEGAFRIRLNEETVFQWKGKTSRPKARTHWSPVQLNSFAIDANGNYQFESIRLEPRKGFRCHALYPKDGAQ